MTDWSGVPHHRVVAVEATLSGHRLQIGSGYLVSASTVLTAAHCTIDIQAPDRPVSALRVIAPGGFSAAIAPSDVVRDPVLDIATLRVPSPPWAATGDWTDPRWARIDRSASGVVPNCEAVGYPMWQQDVSDDNNRSPAEVRGAVRRLEDVTSRNRFLVLRDPELTDVAPPRSARSIGDPDSVWGGISGALVFGRGSAIGVVVEHHPRQGPGAVRVLPLDRVAAADSPAAAGVAAQLGLPPIDRFPWAFPDDFGALLRAAEDAADEAVPDLRGRSRELATLAGLGGPGPSRRRWVRAASFAGKTALLATFAAHPPPRTTVVSCLLNRRKGRNSARYLLDSLTMQLAAVAWREGYVPPSDEWSRFDDFRRLLTAAAAACAGRGDQLLMIIDGLDEYDRDAVVELGEWLPADLPDGMSLLVSSRPDPPGLPADHPLHDAVFDLAGHDGAEGGKELARAELRSAERTDRITRLVLQYLAVVGGGLTTSDLAELLGAPGSRVDAELIERVFDTALGRTVARGPDDQGDHPWVFDHDYYAAAADELVGGPPAAHARRALDDWADRYRSDGWPSSTPRFLLSGYVPYLRSRVVEAANPDDRHAVVDRLCAVVASPGRWTAMLLRHRTPVSPEAEIVESQKAVQSALDDGVLQRSEAEVVWARLALARRGGNRGIVTHVAGPVAGVWALDGDAEAAADFATAILEPDGRTEALGEVAVAVGVGGSRAQLGIALERVLTTARTAGAFGDSVRARIALRLARVGRFPEAEMVGRSIGHTADQVTCLAEIGLVAARSGQADPARALTRSVAAAAERTGFFEPYRPLGRAAEILARLGDHDDAERLLDRAQALTSTGWGKHEFKYRQWAKIVVGTARWRCTALRAAGLDVADDPELRLWFDGGLSWRLTLLGPFVHAVNVAGVLAERGFVDAARTLASAAVDEQRTRTDQHEGADFCGAGAPDIATVLLDAGLVEPVLAFVDIPISPFRSVFGSDWSQWTRDRIGAALVRALARAGRPEDIAARLRQIESDSVRLRAEADTAYEAVLYDHTRAPGAVRRARQVADGLLVQAVDRDVDQRRSALLRRIDDRLDPTAGVESGPRSVSRPPGDHPPQGGPPRGGRPRPGARARRRVRGRRIPRRRGRAGSGRPGPGRGRPLRGGPLGGRHRAPSLVDLVRGRELGAAPARRVRRGGRGSGRAGRARREAIGAVARRGVAREAGRGRGTHFRRHDDGRVPGQHGVRARGRGRAHGQGRRRCAGSGLVDARFADMGASDNRDGGEDRSGGRGNAGDGPTRRRPAPRESGVGGAPGLRLVPTRSGGPGRSGEASTRRPRGPRGGRVAPSGIRPGHALAPGGGGAGWPPAGRRDDHEGRSPPAASPVPGIRRLRRERSH